MLRNHRARIGRPNHRLTIAVTLAAAMAASAAHAQRSGGSLAERLSALRNGWSTSGAEATPAEDLPPAPTAPPIEPRTITPSVQREAPAADSATAAPKAYPRMNPRDLLPRRWFGAGPAEKQAVEPSSPAVSPASPTPPKPTLGATGSTRERLLRQNRSANATPRVAARPAPRAGSVLSRGSAEATARPAPLPRNNSRLARSIAAEVAETLLEPSASGSQATGTDESVASESPTLAEQPSFAVEGTTPSESPADAAPQSAVTETPIAESRSGRVTVAARPSVKTTLPMFIGDEYSSIESEEADAGDDSVDAPSAASAERAEGAFARGPMAKPPSADKPAGVIRSADAEDLLLTQQMPVLVSKVSGPRQIVVGREATYRVLLANRGDVAAEEVVTTVAAPEWADVVTVEARDGVVDRAGSTREGELVWRNATLAAGEVATLTLRVVAREGRPIELAVAHRHRPIDGRTLVEVQEPKLDLKLVGPEEVLYGKPQLFRLTISNPGTGVAENVVLRLTPPGGDTTRQTSHRFGSLAPGEDRAVEIELTAREAGRLLVSAAASADGGVEADTQKDIFCRKAELVVDWRGPSERYAGAAATYYLRVRNPGTATASDVVLNVELPEGFRVLPAPGTPAVESGRLAYRVGSLRAGDDRYFELRGVMRRGGENEVGIQATSAGETRSARVAAKTNVIALADLKLDVLDPKGPIATGEAVEYQIRVTNRGSNDARDVRIIGLFSDGIEPHHIDGSDATIDDGRVELAVIPTMAAGEDRVFTIHARAHEAGTHLFRAEVLCRDLEIKLAAEETTRFFEDETINVAGGRPRTGSRGVLTY